MQCAFTPTMKPASDAGIGRFVSPHPIETSVRRRPRVQSLRDPDVEALWGTEVFGMEFASNAHSSKTLARQLRSRSRALKVSTTNARRPNSISDFATGRPGIPTSCYLGDGGMSRGGNWPASLPGLPPIPHAQQPVDGQGRDISGAVGHRHSRPRTSDFRLRKTIEWTAETHAVLDGRLGSDA